MSFEQLPTNWPDQPLTDPTFAANVVDLMVSIGDRHLGTLTVVLCHPDNRYRSTLTMKLPRFPAHTPAELCRAVLEPIIPSLQTSPDAPVILALGRRSHDRADDHLDEECAQVATALCEDAGVRLLGFYVATKDGVHQPALAALT
ncbi:MAG TPA: hypothetical protein VG497_16095 [Kribbella sp.]|nr:hypothetical protein [Kribbella sp.]